MPGGIVESVEEVQEHGADVVLTIGEVEDVGVGGTGVGLLEGVAAAPDGEGQDEQDTPGDLGTERAADAADVEQDTPDGGGDDLGEPVEQAVEGAATDAEAGAVDGVLLVDVEPVGDEEHGEEQQDVGLEAQGLVQAVQLGHQGGVLHDDDAGAVLADDVLGVGEEQGKAGADEHEHDEADVGAVLDGGGLVVDVGAEGDQGAEHGAHVEDGPEPGEVVALLVLLGVRDHDGSLGGPEETGAHTEEDAGEDGEADAGAVQGAEQRAGVDGIADAAEGEAHADAEPVDEGAAEETEDGEGGVESRVLLFAIAMVSFIESLSSTVAAVIASE